MGRDLLWPLHVRGIVHGDPLGQRAVALYRLDDWARPCRRDGLGRAHHLWFDLCGRALAVEARADVFPGADRDPLLARARGNADLRFRDVELGHHSEIGRAAWREREGQYV